MFLSYRPVASPFKLLRQQKASDLSRNCRNSTCSRNLAPAAGNRKPDRSGGAGLFPRWNALPRSPPSVLVFPGFRSTTLKVLGEILILLLGGALAGRYFARRSSLAAFFTASKNAGPVLAGLAGSAAGLSAFVFVGGPGYFATVGLAGLWIIASAPLTGVLQCLAVGENITARTEKHPSFSIPELVESRWGGGWPRGLTAAIIVAGSLAMLAVQIRALAILGDRLLPIPGWLFTTGVLIVTVSYSAGGGMRLGLPIEALQGLLMAVIALGISSIVLHRAGGVGDIVQSIGKLRPEFFHPLAGGESSRLISLFLLFAIGTCAQPHYLQKFLMLKNPGALRNLPIVSTTALISILSVWVGMGLAGALMLAEGRFQITSGDQLTPMLLKNLGGGILLVPVLLGVLAAVMSTAATLLNMVAAAFSMDFPAALGWKTGPDAGTLPVARVATIAAAVAASIPAFSSSQGIIMLGVLGWGMFTAGFFPIMVFGIGDPWITRKAAVAALVGGPLIQVGVEIARGYGLLSGWEAGLTGTAAGILLLYGISARDSGRSRPFARNPRRF